MSHPADARHFLEAKKALTKILQAREALSFDGIFGEARNKWWSRQIMKRAQKAGVVEMLPRANSRATPYFKATPLLDATLQSEELLSEVLWPAVMPDAAMPESPESEPPEPDESSIDDEEADDEPGERAVESVPPPPDDEPSAMEMLSALVRMAAAILENVVHTRKSIDAIGEHLTVIEGKLSKIEETWS